MMILSSCSSEDTSGFGAVPVNLYNGESWFLFEMQPGNNLQDEFFIVNNEDSPITFQLSAVDSLITESGDFTLLSSDSPENLYMSEWVEFEEEQVTLDPQETRIISFNFNLPDEVDYGEYSGGIVIVPTNFSSNTDVGISIVTQIGLRIYLKVTDDPQPVEVESNYDYDYTVYYWVAGMVSALTFLALMYVIFVMKDE